MAIQNRLSYAAAPLNQTNEECNKKKKKRIRPIRA